MPDAIPRSIRGLVIMAKFCQEPNPQRLTLMSESGSRFGKRKYRCACGNTKWIRPDNVNSDRVKSCGCLRKDGKNTRRQRGEAKEMRGRRFGKLKVISRSRKTRTNQRTSGAFWFCVCDCGNGKTVYGGSLRRGKTKSCGKCKE